MRRHNISYFFSTGIKSFFRNGFFSFAAIAVLVLVMLVCGSFVLLLFNINHNVEQIDDFNEVVVYAELGVSNEIINYIESEINELPQVATYEFVPKEVSLAKERERYGEEYQHLFERYTLNTDEIPLPDIFRIEYKDVNELDVLIYSLENIEGISKVRNNKEFADNIYKVKQVIMIVCVFLTVMLLIVSLFIIANTIRMALNAREVEIHIMRYIGATNTFITLPLIVEAFLIAIFSTGISYALQHFSYKYITEEIIADYGIVSTIPFSEFQYYVLGAFAAVSVVLCVLITISSTRKYLKA